MIDMGAGQFNENVMPFRQPSAHLTGNQHEIELDDVRRLQDVSSLLIGESNIEALYDGILDAAIGLMRSDMGTIQEFDPKAGELRLLGTRGFEQAAVAYPTSTNRKQASAS